LLWTQFVEARGLPVVLRRICAGGSALGAGALLLAVRRRRRGDDVSDAPIRSALAARGFRFIDLGAGWQADGRWGDVELSVRRQSDYQATRFGRPWVLVVHLPGEPRHPWPFMPDQGKVIERDSRGFVVVVAELSFDGQQGLLAERLDALCAAISR